VAGAIGTGANIRHDQHGRFVVVEL
jgi:hypothetical protein